MPDPVTVAEIAKRLGLPRQTVKTWRTRKVLPAPKWTPAGAPLWEWRDIERWYTKRLETDPRTRLTGRLSKPSNS